MPDNNCVLVIDNDPGILTIFETVATLSDLHSELDEKISTLYSWKVR